MSENESFFDDLREDVDVAHETLDGANPPPLAMWKSIRTQAKPEIKEENPMIASNAPLHAPTFLNPPVTAQKGGVRHTLSIVASFLIVMSVALGGWFATMQLNQPDGSNGHVALFGRSDGSATCDVEPMTVDEVMEIVRNPYSVMGIEPGTMVIGVPENAYDDLAEPLNYPFDLDVLSRETFTPGEEAFTESSTKLNGFLECTQTGSVAQIFRFMVPVQIQRIVLSTFPVFREEAQVRAGVEELLDYPAYLLVAQMNEAIKDPDLTYQANLDRSSATSFPLRDAQRYEATQMILFGTSVTDADGNLIFQNNASGSVDPVGAGLLKTTDRLRVVMIQSMYNDQWYVLATIPE